MNEKISALLDGELSQLEHNDVPTDVLVNHNQRQTLVRYQLIGSLLRNEGMDGAVQGVKTGLADRIAEQIAAEPGWLLPVKQIHTAEEETVEISANVVPITSKKPAFFGGFAVAAAISALAIFVGAPQWQSPVAQSTPVLAAAKTVSNSANQWQNTEAEHEDALNTLLVEHGEFSSSAGLNGLMAYAKFVSYDSSQ
ncbi:MAG: negative regulator of sigma E activity [Parasphingorhabdus sp.]|jgi:negative regulator of sigma E activity